MCCLLLTSCIKDELATTECDIISAWVEGDQYKNLFYQPESDMRFEQLSSTESRITFTVRSILSLPDIPVHFTITPGATIQPASGSVQNFREQPVTYTVTSEDGSWQRKSAYATGTEWETDRRSMLWNPRMPNFFFLCEEATGTKEASEKFS